MVAHEQGTKPSSPLKPSSRDRISLDNPLERLHAGTPDELDERQWQGLIELDMVRGNAY
jgi:hypothetical protein